MTPGDWRDLAVSYPGRVLLIMVLVALRQISGGAFRWKELCTTEELCICNKIDPIDNVRGQKSSSSPVRIWSFANVQRLKHPKTIKSFSRILLVSDPYHELASTSRTGSKKGALRSCTLSCDTCYPEYKTCYPSANDMVGWRHIYHRHKALIAGYW